MRCHGPDDYQIFDKGRAQAPCRNRMSRASDYLEYRLLQLINADILSVPSDQSVADLFHLTLSEVRTLIRDVYTKYRFDLTSGWTT
jgi:hypothetical protein